MAKNQEGIPDPKYLVVAIPGGLSASFPLAHSDRDSTLLSLPIRAQETGT